MHHISNTIPPCSILPTSFSPLRSLQGVAESCLWEGCQVGLSHLLAALTWTAHLLPHPPSHHLRHHPPLHLLLQGLWQGQLFEYARSICETLAEVTRVSPTWPHSSRRTTTEGGGCHCHDRLTAIALRHVHLPPHFHLRARFPTTPTAPTSGQRGAGRRTRTWGSNVHGHQQAATSSRKLYLCLMGQ